MALEILQEHALEECLENLADGRVEDPWYLPVSSIKDGGGGCEIITDR